MSNLVIYSSKYGSTKTYALELAKRLGWKAMPYQKADKKHLKQAGEMVLASSIRMGKMKISKWVKNNVNLIKPMCKAVIAVGGTESANQDYYIETVEKKPAFYEFEKEQIFGCGGRQVVSEMKGFDSFAFKMLDKMVKDPKERNDILGDKDHMDMTLLDPVVKYLTNN